MQRSPTRLIVEPFITLTEAAAAIGIPLFKLRRAAKTGIFSVYRIGNGRALCRLSEVIAGIERAARRAGDE